MVPTFYRWPPTTPVVAVPSPVIRGNKSHSSNQVTIRPPRRRVPHRDARAATSWSPRPPSASRPAERSLGISGPPRSVTSTRTTPSPALTATVTDSPGAPEPECRTELPKTSLTSRTASSRHGCPGPSSSETNARAARARSARPASVTLSRTAAPAISAPAFPAALVPGNHAGRLADTPGWTPDSGANVKARAPPERSPEPTSSGYPHRSLAPIPVRYASVDPATQRTTATQDDARRDTRKWPASTRIRS
jgi:hypothetical protein